MWKSVLMREVGGLEERTSEGGSAYEVGGEEWRDGHHYRSKGWPSILCSAQVVDLACSNMKSVRLRYDSVHYLFQLLHLLQMF